MANLASVILEGSNLGSSMSLDKYEFDANLVVEESSFSDAAVATLFSDIMEAEQSYMVADVVGAATIIHENSNGSDVDPVDVQESVIKSGITKIKVAFQKFIAKIKEYYNRVINWFKAMFSNAGDFVKNYGDMIKKKAGKVKGFHYTGYKYDQKAGESKADSIRKSVDNKMQDIVKGYDYIGVAHTSKEFNEHMRKNVLKSSFDDDNKTSANEEVDNFLTKEFHVSDISELKTSVIEAYRNGDDSKSDIKDFEANSVSDMLDFIKSSGSLINKLQKQLHNYEEKTKSVISKLNKFETVKEDGDGADNIVANASYVSSLMSAFLNVYKAPCEVEISVLKAMSHEYLGALKKFYNFKGNAVKESANVFDAEAYAMLENAIILEGDDDSDPEGESGDGDATTESVVAGILEQAAKYTF